jgi:uncharacterized membrane protein YdjX (TVP38/TMEM64 family)
MKRILILLAVLALIASFFYFDLNEILSLEWLKSSQAQLDSWWQESPLLLGSIFFALYLIVTALSLPGAAIMTLAGGAIFGLLWGTIMVSFASSIGATLAFLIGRYLFRENVQQRFGARLRAINKGVEREGAFYLFSLRLIPIFPFFLINLVMALTPMKAWTF